MSENQKIFGQSEVAGGGWVPASIRKEKFGFPRRVRNGPWKPQNKKTRRSSGASFVSKNEVANVSPQKKTSSTRRMLNEGHKGSILDPGEGNWKSPD